MSDGYVKLNRSNNDPEHQLLPLAYPALAFCCNFESKACLQHWETHQGAGHLTRGEPIFNHLHSSGSF